MLDMTGPTDKNPDANVLETRLLIVCALHMLKYECEAIARACSSDPAACIAVTSLIEVLFGGGPRDGRESCLEGKSVCML